MEHGIRAPVEITCDISAVVYALRKCTQVTALGCSRSFECGESAVCMPHEAMHHSCRIPKVSRDLAVFVNAESGGSGSKDVALFVQMCGAIRDAPRRIELGEAAILVARETVNPAVRSRVVIPNDLPVRVDAHGECPFAATRNRSRNVEFGIRPIRVPHKTMKTVVRIRVVSYDLPACVDALRGCIVTARRIERCGYAVLASNKPVRHVVRHVISRKLAHIVDTACDGANAAGRIELGECTVHESYKTMAHAVWVREVVAGDFTVLIDALGKCAQSGFLARGGRIECNEGAVPVPHKAVQHAGNIFVVSRDLAAIVDALRARTLACVLACSRCIERDDVVIDRSQRGSLGLAMHDTAQKQAGYAPHPASASQIHEISC